MRYFYSFLLYLVMPFLFLRLLWKSRLQPEYRQRLSERLGFYPFQLEKCIWVHAVSVGESLAAIPLIKALKKRYPDLPILVTTMTPTGAARIQSALGELVTHAYIPYDFPDAMQRFLHTMRPKIAIIMETELWPNLVAACQQQHIPVCLVNARLSAKSARGYQRIAILTKEMLQHVNLIVAHGEVDAERFIALGAPRTRVMISGNIKFDIEIPNDLIAQSAELRVVLGDQRFVWIAASTHEGEEEIILAAHRALLTRNPNALLILVPRHPERFASVAKLAEQSFVVARRSLQQAVTNETQVYIGDTMGELLLLYGVADVAFVAGSLVPRGGHNMLEPGALGKPILTGEHLFNFAEISELFITAQALTVVKDTDMLAERLRELMENHAERLAMGQRALAVMTANRGALQKQMQAINSLLVVPE